MIELLFLLVCECGFEGNRKNSVLCELLQMNSMWRFIEGGQLFLGMITTLSSLLDILICLNSSL